MDVFGLTMNVSKGASLPQKASFTRAAVAASDKVGQIVTNALKAEAPVRSGRLQNSIFYMRHTDFGASVELKWVSKLPYAHFVIHGAATHQTTYPVAARALHWNGPNGSVFAKSVGPHVTNKPNDFPRRAWENAKGDIPAAYKSFLKETFKS